MPHRSDARQPSPIEMFDELTKLGLIIPAREDPIGPMEAVEFFDLPTTLAYATPPVPVWNERIGKKSHAALGHRPKGNKKRKR